MRLSVVRANICPCSHQRAHNWDTRLVFESDALGELQAVTSSVCERSQPVLVSWPSNASAAQDEEQEQEQELRDKLSSVLHIWFRSLVSVS